MSSRLCVLSKLNKQAPINQSPRQRRPSPDNLRILGIDPLITPHLRLPGKQIDIELRHARPPMIRNMLRLDAALLSIHDPTPHARDSEAVPGAFAVERGREEADGGAAEHAVAAAGDEEEEGREDGGVEVVGDFIFYGRDEWFVDGFCERVDFFEFREELIVADFGGEECAGELDSCFYGVHL